jgi:hypothetical protein
MGPWVERRGERLDVTVVRSSLSADETRARLDAAREVDAEDLMCDQSSHPLPAIATRLTLHASPNVMRLAASLVASRAARRDAALSVTLESPVVDAPTRLAPFPLAELAHLDCVEVRVRVLTDAALLWLGEHEVHVLTPVTDAAAPHVLYTLGALADPGHCAGDVKLAANLGAGRLSAAIDALRVHTEAVLRRGLEQRIENVHALPVRAAPWARWARQAMQ